MALKHKKKITLEDLAMMTQRGFIEVNDNITAFKADVNDHFELVERRLESVEMRLDAIEKELFDIKKKLENVIYRHELEILRDRVSSLEKRLETARRGR